MVLIVAENRNPSLTVIARSIKRNWVTSVLSFHGLLFSESSGFRNDREKLSNRSRVTPDVPVYLVPAPGPCDLGIPPLSRIIRRRWLCEALPCSKDPAPVRLSCRNCAPCGCWSSER